MLLRGRRRSRRAIAAACMFALAAAALAVFVAALLLSREPLGFGRGALAIVTYLAQEARVAVAGEDAVSRAAVDSLRAAFNREREHVRLVAILSPT